MSYRSLRKRQDKCRDIDTLKMILEDALVELKEDEDIILEYRKIEKELGIDLITLFKALKNGIYHNQYVGVSSEPWSFQVDIKNKLFKYHIQDMGASWDLICYFKDYGKTWALTKEELL